jgi:hypothetical protein
MRLSDARLHCRRTKLIYLDQRLPPWLTEDGARDRSNRLLGLHQRLHGLPGLEFFPKHPAQRGFVHWGDARGLT